MSSTDLESTLSPLRALVNERLAYDVRPLADTPPRLQEAMAYSLLAGGKRLRPVLVLLASQACGGDIQTALPAASAIEMIHTYSLVHDDLPAMDDDDLRRGRPTNHVVFGEANAILAGDGLLTLAFEVMARDLPPAVAAACCADLASAAGWQGMVAGQVADLEGEGNPDLGLQELEQIHRRKTGRLLCSALTLGGRCASATEGQLRQLEEYGRHLGLAFQITDDLLDVAGDPAKLGKAAQKDAGRGKVTYPGLLGVEESRAKAREAIAAAHAALADWGERATTFRQLADFILERDH